MTTEYDHMAMRDDLGGAVWGQEGLIGPHEPLKGALCAGSGGNYTTPAVVEYLNAYCGGSGGKPSWLRYANRWPYGYMAI